MRILHILGRKRVPRDPERMPASGVVRVALELARTQAQRGHDVWLATVDTTPWWAEWHGVRLLALSPNDWARSLYPTGSFHVHLPFVRLTLRRRFDVVHAHLYSYTRFLRSRARIVHFHSDPLNGALDSRALARVLRDSDGQIGVSRFITDRLTSASNDATNVRTVYNGVDQDSFAPDRQEQGRSALRNRLGIGPNDVAFLFAGAVVAEKGVLHLANAFRAVCSETTSGRAHLLIAGGRSLWGGNVDAEETGAAYEADVHAALAHLVPSRVHMLGVMASDEMATVYAASDAVVIPSVWQEPFPLVALEAIASGRPVIASDVGGLPEIVGERNGALVPAGDERALAAAMLRTATAVQAREIDPAAIRRTVAHLSWPSAADQVLAFYEALLEA